MPLTQPTLYTSEWRSQRTGNGVNMTSLSELRTMAMEAILKERESMFIKYIKAEEIKSVNHRSKVATHSLSRS